MYEYIICVGIVVYTLCVSTSKKALPDNGSLIALQVRLNVDRVGRDPAPD